LKVFEHITILLSFVYALALTHLLSRIGVLLTVRKRVNFSGLLALMMLNGILIAFANWLSLWDFRSVREWDIASITVQFVQAIIIFFLCSLAAPEGGREGPIDLEAFYWEQRPLFYSVFIAGATVAMIANASYLKTANAVLFVKENLFALSTILPGTLALALRARWAQWTAGISVLLLFLYFSVTFEAVLT